MQLMTWTVQEMALTVLKLLIVGISTVGIWEIVHHYFKKVDISFIPAISIAIETTFLFFAGILNCLPLVSWSIHAVGLLSVGYSLFRERNLQILKRWTRMPILFLGIVTLLSWFYLQGKIFTHYDNFTHWGLVARTLLEENRFPTFRDELILFPEYPLGSSVFVYFIASFVGKAEPVQMIAQAYVIFANIIPLFSVQKKQKSIPVLIAVSVFTYFVLSYNNSIMDLLVDTLISIVPMTCVLYVTVYCDREKSAEAMLPVAFMLCQTMQIKNSGIFYVLMVAVMLLMNRPKGKFSPVRAACILFPFVTFYLWHQHCLYVFSTGGISYHAMTLKNYIHIASGKTLGLMYYIFIQMIKYVFTWKDTYLTCGIIALVEFFAVREKKENEISLKTYFPAMAMIMCFCFQIGLYGMYLFSMPGPEAVEIAQIERYERGIILSMLYLVMVPGIEMMSDMRIQEKKQIIYAAATVCILLLNLTLTTGKPVLSLSNLDSWYQPDERIWIESIKKENSIPEEESYTILVPEGSIGGYSYYLGKYIFRTTDVVEKTMTSEEELSDIYTEYLLIYDDSKPYDEWLKNYEESHLDLPWTVISLQRE